MIISGLILELWRKHLGEENELYDNRFNPKSPFHNTFSPIENNTRSKFNGMEFEFDDSHLRNYWTLQQNIGNEQDLHKM